VDEWKRNVGRLNLNEPKMWIKLGFKERFATRKSAKKEKRKKANCVKQKKELQNKNDRESFGFFFLKNKFCD
jgi:hypothetical protein